MKARVKATGEIVQIIDIDFDTLFCNNGGHYTLEHLEGIECDPDYWTRLEHQAAIGAMQGMLNNSLLIAGLLKVNKSHEDIVTEVTGTAIRYAHALVEKYKKEE